MTPEEEIDDSNRTLTHQALSSSHANRPTRGKSDRVPENTPEGAFLRALFPEHYRKDDSE